jgi:hypothetical protein
LSGMVCTLKVAGFRGDTGLHPIVLMLEIRTRIGVPRTKLRG